jgi:hypothetical protein
VIIGAKEAPDSSRHLWLWGVSSANADTSADIAMYGYRGRIALPTKQQTMTRIGSSMKWRWVVLFLILITALSVLQWLQQD